MKAPLYSDLARHRYDKAVHTLKEGRDAFALGNFGNAVNRCYYAIFSAMRSLLAMKKLDSKTHAGVLSLFNQHFVNEKLLPKGFGKLARDAKTIRERADYGDFEITTKEIASEYLEKAAVFLKRVEDLLRQLLLTANGNGKNGKNER